MTFLSKTNNTPNHFPKINPEIIAIGAPNPKAKYPNNCKNNK